MSNPIAGFDLTIPAERHDKDQIIKVFLDIAKKWVFQLEKGEETGYLHYQCRISLSTKKRLHQMIKLVNTVLEGACVKPTSTTAFVSKDFSYVMKNDTRIDGPWSDKDNEKPHYIQKRFLGKINWLSWQKSVISMINKDPDDRTVNIIIDSQGNQGKSFLTTYLGTFKKAVRIPQQPEARDIMRMVMNMDKCSCYFIDLPRGISQNSQNSMYSAIEEIKNGYAFDDRYKFKDEYFEPPHVWVFTNTIPDIKLLTKDRWVFWNIVDQELVRLELII